MSKLSKIKAELAKLLLKHSVISTDKAVIEYDGEELTEGVEVYSTDENGEKVAVADGEYKTEDNKVITVKDGKVESIVEVEVEETVEAEEEEKKDDTNEQKEVVDEQPTDSVDEETEEEVKLEDVNAEIAELKKEIAELYAIVEKLVKKVGDEVGETDERLKKLECKSQAKPVVEEFEQVTKSQNTGNAKLDKFLSKYGKN